ncbi:hypothetical protein F4811DRAFT_526891, partial [Daldinia bambusicola]
MNSSPLFQLSLWLPLVLLGLITRMPKARQTPRNELWLMTDRLPDIETGQKEVTEEGKKGCCMYVCTSTDSIRFDLI